MACAAALGVFAVALSFAACDDATHPYTARGYDEARGCLMPLGSVDVVDGTDPGNCAPVCLNQPNRDAGRAIFVSTMCAPYPFGVDTSGKDSACGPALDALARGDICLSDGGSSAPREAGVDAHD